MATDCTAGDMPQIGYGTWLAAKGEVGQAVKEAIKIGYRHFDCAYIYGNQPEIGEALGDVFKDKLVERKDLFITSKIWNTYHSRERALRNVEMILEELGFEYLDLCLIHWPMGYKEGGELMPKNEDGTKILLSDVDILETWSALEDAFNQGKCRAIGLSNFNQAQIQKILDNGKIKPTVLQIEIHPYFQQDELVKFCRERAIQVTAYSPLGSSSGNPFKKADYPSIFTDSIITDIAEKHGKTNAQIALRYQIQRGICVIPKSMNAQRMAENLRLFDFILSPEEMQAISRLETHKRITHLPLSCHSPLYPWKVPS